MLQPLVSHKITPAALQLLRMITQSTGEKQYAVLARLLAAEWSRVQQQDGTQKGPRS